MDNNKMRVKLPVGIESFEKIRSMGFYYVDKTGMIGDLLDNWGEVNLFTRPRRFGKSLNMSMLKAFFETGCDKSLFEGLAISKETALCEKYMGKFPVISVSLKEANADTFEVAKQMLCYTIGMEAGRILESIPPDGLNEHQKSIMARLAGCDMGDAELMNSLYLLSTVLCQYYGRKVIILIDEYDVPLAKANEKGYYEPMAMLIRNMLGRALKTNDSLYFAVMTGCLRVAKESIFTGLNNPKILTVTDVRFDEYFGFTDGEVREMLAYYGLSDFYGTVKEWYDGYRFGNVDVYCPWDVVCYCDAVYANPGKGPEDYWLNTSGNDVIKHFLKKAKPATKREIESLISGESVTKLIRQELTYKDLYSSIDNLWSVLFTTGYLTYRGEPGVKKLELVIPNMEIRNIFLEQISEWFQDSAREDGGSLNLFCEAFIRGEAREVQERFEAYLRKTISVRDTAVRKEMKENFYHGILLGLLGFKDTWDVFSNKESGNGYSDILVEAEDEKIGIVIEVKYAGDGSLHESCLKAMEQIEEMRYADQVREDGMRAVLKYGIACFKKTCEVMLEREEKPVGPKPSIVDTISAR